MVSQLKIEQPYVDDYITFAYCHYDSPYNVDPGYQVTYLDYLKTGSLETSPPSVPPHFTADLQTNGDVTLKWGVSTDNIGVCGYYVYRNGKMISKKQIRRTGKRNRNSEISLTTLTDVYLHSNTDYTYQVRAYDFADNVSSPTPAITVNTGKIVYLPNKVSAGCPYTISLSTYTDSSETKNMKLTDGIYADSATVRDTRWEGFHDTHQKPRDVVIDLGKTMPVQQFVADYLLDPKVFVYLPERVTVLVSTDNVNFEEVAEFPHPNVPYDASAGSYKYRYTLSGPVEARYVDFRTVPSARWFDELTYEDEFEIRNNTETGKK